MATRQLISTTPRYPGLLTRRWTRAEHDRPISLGILDEDERIGPKGIVSPLAAPRARVRVADLLP